MVRTDSLYKVDYVSALNGKSKLMAGNACYNSVQKVLSSSLLSRNSKIKILVHIIMILPVVFVCVYTYIVYIVPAHTGPQIIDLCRVSVVMDWAVAKRCHVSSVDVNLALRNPHVCMNLTLYTQVYP
jgi:hypothetical protein